MSFQASLSGLVESKSISRILNRLKKLSYLECKVDVIERVYSKAEEVKSTSKREQTVLRIWHSRVTDEW